MLIVMYRKDMKEKPGEKEIKWQKVFAFLTVPIIPQKISKALAIRSVGLTDMT